MVDYQFSLQLQELKRSHDQLSERIKQLSERVISTDSLWDGEDICRNWKVSQRTLATWRSKGDIGFIKLKGKIWYPSAERERFLEKNLKV